jgi:hypothetical protein
VKILFISIRKEGLNIIKIFAFDEYKVLWKYVQNIPANLGSKYVTCIVGVWWIFILSSISTIFRQYFSTFYD